MPRRSAFTLEDVAALPTLAHAFWRAARGHRHTEGARRFGEDLDASLARLRASILDGDAPEGRWASFKIFDPKARQILAPCFGDRILHHALMVDAGPMLDRALVADTFACRTGKGTLAAVRRAQHHLRRFPWFVKTDVRAYFASVQHAALRELLRRRFKDRGVLALWERILTRAPVPPGLGLPIGALTSQHLANAYLDAMDRFLSESLRVRGLVRYMDDVIWWCDSRAEAARTLVEARAFLRSERGLELKEDARIGRSDAGVTFLGYRILPGALRLSLRRRRRYTAARRRWERAFQEGRVDSRGLQAGYAAALGITAHADAAEWRRAELRRRLTLDA